jgi:LPXTG-site transpeptidase (sortase) family protein
MTRYPLQAKGLALAVVALLAIFTLAACGGGSHPADRPTAAPSTTAAAASSDAPPSPTADVPTPGAPGDKVVIQVIGVDAPISYKTVAPDGTMPNPDGPDDIAFYDFSNWPGLGGVPGRGNLVLAGHVDWGAQHGVGCKHNTVPAPCQAVLWNLNKLKTGDQIEVDVGGKAYTYRITGSRSLPADGTDWNQVFASTDQPTITIVTCGGDFNPVTREYSNRQVLTGVGL